MDRKTVGGFALGVLVTAVGLGAVPASGRGRSTVALSRAGFHATVDDVLDRYVDPVEESAVLSAGLRAVVGHLDPYSYYLSAEERRTLQERVAAGGSTGLEVTLVRDSQRAGEKLLEVAAVQPGSPAALAGLQPGDHVLRLNGRVPAELAHAAAIESLLLGPAHEKVELTIQRRSSAEPETLMLERRELASQASVVSKLVEVAGKRVLSLRVHRFSAGTGRAVQRALQRHGSVAGVVIDLRGNPGGVVDEALVVADLFVESGVLTRTRGRGGQILREEHARPVGTDTAVPIVVLQDAHTASAAELLAAALRDHGRARLVGQRSYGKGTIQEIIGLADGSLLKLTTARYRSPSDHPIDGVGVEPHVHVANPDAIWAMGLDVLAQQLRG